MNVEALIKLPRHLLSVCINYTGFPIKDEKHRVLEILGSGGQAIGSILRQIKLYESLNFERGKTTLFNRRRRFFINREEFLSTKFFCKSLKFKFLIFLNITHDEYFICFLRTYFICVNLFVYLNVLSFKLFIVNYAIFTRVAREKKNRIKFFLISFVKKRTKISFVKKIFSVYEKSFLSLKCPIYEMSYL